MEFLEEEGWRRVDVFPGLQPACQSRGGLMQTVWKTERIQCREGTYAEEDEKLTLPPISPKHIPHSHACPTDKYTIYASIHHTQYIYTSAKHMVCTCTTHNVTCHIEHYMCTQTRQTHSICTCKTIHYLTDTIAYAYTCMHIYLIQHNMQTIYAHATCSYIYTMPYAHILCLQYPKYPCTHNLCPHTPYVHTLTYYV